VILHSKVSLLCSDLVICDYHADILLKWWHFQSLRNTTQITYCLELTHSGVCNVQLLCILLLFVRLSFLLTKVFRCLIALNTPTVLAVYVSLKMLEFCILHALMQIYFTNWPHHV
jgi:hypothetical protein